MSAQRLPSLDEIHEKVLAVFLQEADLDCCLEWAADDDGKFIQERLERIAELRGYKIGWVYHTMRKTFDKALIENWRWKAEQRRLR